MQIVKHRDEKGNFLGVRLRAAHGNSDGLAEISGQRAACVERGHLAMRTFSRCLTRQGIAFSKNTDMRKASAALEDIHHDLIKPMKTLRLDAEENSGLKWLPRTPTMAAGQTGLSGR